MNELIKYQKDFNEIVDVLSIALSGRVPNVKRKDYIFLSQEVHRILKKVNSNYFPIDREDICQQLSMYWILAIRTYYKNKPKVHIRQYIIRRSVWYLRDWVEHELSVPCANPIEYNHSVQYPININLSFLFENHYNLSSYDRLLIYLKFFLDKDILQMSRILQRDAYYVGKHVAELTEKLRRLLNDDQNSE